MRRHSFPLLMWLFLLAAGSSEAAEALSGSRPNILVIMPDDMSFGAISAYGGGMKTPSMDDLHKRGVRFTSFHVSPTCSPTRAALLTGRHEFYSGVTHTIVLRDRMNPKRRTVAQALGDAGYATGIFGKWHLGDEKAYRPDARGFDEVYIHGAGGIGQRMPTSSDFPGNSYITPFLYHNGTIVKTEGYCTDLFFAQAMRWISQKKTEGKPFFAFIPTNVTHNPQIPPPGTPKDVKGPVARQAVLANLDQNIGRLMEFLSKEKLLERTLVVFLTDNGASSGNLRLRGGKATVYEGGIRVPCFFYWKGRIEGGRDCGRLAGHIDLFATFVDLAGGKDPVPGGKVWDGRSLVPLLADPKADWAKRYFTSHRGRWPRPEGQQHTDCAIQDERFKLVANSALYDLTADLQESKDVAADHPDVVARLRKVYDEWWTDVQPHLVNENAAQRGVEYRAWYDLFREQFGEGAFQEALKRVQPRPKKPPRDLDQRKKDREKRRRARSIAT